MTPDYFRALGITLVAGRAFGASRSRRHAAGADREPGAGRQVLRRPRSDRPRDPVRRQQAPRNRRRGRRRALSVRGTAGRSDVLPAAGAERRAMAVPRVHRLDRRRPRPQRRRPPCSDRRCATPIRSNRSRACARSRRSSAGSMAARRFNTWIVGLFAATALLLAAVGTYGVMAFAVTSRTRELGVRAALGATPADLIRMVLGQGLLLTLAASAIGLAAAVIADALHGVDALQRGAARSADVRARGRRPGARRDRRDADPGASGDDESIRSSRSSAIRSGSTAASVGSDLSCRAR